MFSIFLVIYILENLLYYFQIFNVTGRNADRLNQIVLRQTQ